MDVKKTKKSHAHYEPDFKEEILRIRIAAQLNSGKNVDEISKTFGISRNIFGRRSVYLVASPLLGLKFLLLDIQDKKRFKN